ncbi:ribonuclease HII [Ampullimonas aquatilis]|uniref:ribonuclease HII n=1 Tax=Ampullimonas aquatilis TaxID=1341549 RepID=UPI003C7343CC
MQTQLLLSSESGLLVCGVDEAGRGPLAGPVVAAAVILDPNQPIDGLRDSKKLSEKQRERLFDVIQSRALAWSIAEASVQEIDQINILQATMLAMQRAIDSLQPRPGKALVDGNRAPKVSIEVETIIKGDAKEPAISAASILAKVYRDRLLHVLHAAHPQYALDIHKGYPTALHLARLAEHGASACHRLTFGPVRKVLAQVS